MNYYKKIYKEIKKAKKIVIARHVGPDPDAMGSTLGLKEIILNTFPDKEVYVIGASTVKFKYFGALDKFDDSMKDALFIVTDTPDLKRIDGASPTMFKKSIKIDHHPFIEKTCDIEWIDDTASSASQMIIELVLHTNLRLNQSAAFKLYTGLVSDTNRFMFKYSTAKTFSLVSYLLKETNIDITSAYSNLYMRPYKEVKFEGYLYQNIKITENKVGYIVITDDILKEYDVDTATPGNMINDFNYIDDIVVWVTFTYDSEADVYRVSIRSRGPIINDVASRFGGGGHIYASGIKLKNKDDIENVISALDETCKKYLNKKSSVLN